MRQPLTTFLAVVLAATLAAGCGSDDTSPSGGGGAGATATSKSSAKPAEVKSTSTRGKLLTCMRDAGFQVTHEGQDESTATNYTVAGDDAKSKKAVIVIHSNRGEAVRAATKAGEEKGLNTVPFGRAVFIRYAATDTEAGVLANCVAEQYVH
jgi:hypothetical protein